DADIGLHDAPVINNERIRDHGVHGAASARRLPLPHAVADHLPAAELHLLAIGGEILLDLYDKLRIRQPHFVAGCRAEHIRIGATRNLIGHRRSSKLTHYGLAEAINRARAGDLHQSHGAALARLETHGRPSWNIEAEAARRLALEAKGGVG